VWEQRLEILKRSVLNLVGNRVSNINLNVVNHFVSRKQHLTDDSWTDDIFQIVKDVGGLHATSPTTPYLSMFSRAKDFTREKLDEELYVKRNQHIWRSLRGRQATLLEAIVWSTRC
jgi:hypothetical protein